MASTDTQRAGHGRTIRRNVPRSSHGLWEPLPDRPDPVALLEEQAATREPKLVPLRYSRMSATPFTFFRGAAYVMAWDLAQTPTSGIDVQACGDAHLANFGVYGAPDRRLVFDLNDFDETLPGPWEWDVKRLAASVEIAGRDRRFNGKARRTVVAACARAYRHAMRDFAARGHLEVWYARLDVDETFEQLRRDADRAELRRAERTLDKARQKDSVRALQRLTQVIDGKRRIKSAPPLIVPVEQLRPDLDRQAMSAVIEDLLRQYRETLRGDVRTLMQRYRFVDLAHKVVGVGSVGTRAWITLLLGRDDDDPLFLQVKEAQQSVLEPFVGRSRFRHHGRRVVEGQRLMQAASDSMLGWIRAPAFQGVERDFYVRQLWDMKGSANLDAITPGALETYADLCGWTLARAHARSGNRFAIAEYLGRGDRFERAIVEFAGRYADQNERDHKALLDAIDSGRIEARTDL